MKTLHDSVPTSSILIMANEVMIFTGGLFHKISPAIRWVKSLATPSLKTIPVVLFLASPVHAATSEAWWLEMDVATHAALMKRFADGDPPASREVTERLPQLVKDGRVKELEWVAEASKTGGRHHPLREYGMKLPDGRKFPAKALSSLKTNRPKNDLVQFEIRTEGEGIGAALLIRTDAPLSKHWQPLFSAESGGKARVLLARDPESEIDFWKPAALLKVAMPVPEPLTLTWVLGENHPVLQAEGTGITGATLSFEDHTTRESGYGKAIRNFGVATQLEISRTKQSSIKFERLSEDKRPTTVGKVSETRAQFEKLAESLKLPVTTYVEKFNREGRHFHEDKKIAGEGTLSIIRLSSSPPGDGQPVPVPAVDDTMRDIIVGTTWHKTTGPDTPRRFMLNGKFYSGAHPHDTYQITGRREVTLIFGVDLHIKCRVNEECTEMTELGGQRHTWKREMTENE